MRELPRGATHLAEATMISPAESPVVVSYRSMLTNIDRTIKTSITNVKVAAINDSVTRHVGKLQLIHYSPGFK